eukprot:scaffold69625_cov71-Phaeocystis_antarctica.AAC.1
MEARRGGNSGSVTHRAVTSTVISVVDGELSERLARHFNVLHRRWNPCECHHGRHITKVRDVLGRGKREKRSWVGQKLAGTAKDAKADEQLADEWVERVAGGQPERQVSCCGVLRLNPVQQVDHALVLHEHALRLARAARRVDHVRQVVRPHARRRSRVQANSHTSCRHLRHAPCVVQHENRAAEPPR